MLPGPAVPGHCLVSYHFLWGKLSTRTVHKGYIAELEPSCVPPIGAAHDYRQPTSPNLQSHLLNVS